MTTPPKPMQSVPVLITWDIDPDQWIPFERRQWALNTAMEMCYPRGIHATFFFTAKSAPAYHAEFEKLKAQGHEIGCHGFTHGDEENYDRMSEEMQRDYITKATQTLTTLADIPIRAFRSPRVKMSAITLRLLAENGYRADSSVCSQRIDLVSSNFINLGWIFAPRRPYRPHRDSAYRAGQVPIWEIPVSAVIVPFISSAFRVLGLATMKRLFKLLYLESRRTGKPIVYLSHPAEFLGSGNDEGFIDKWQTYARREVLSLSYIRAHGFVLRNLLYGVHGTNLLKDTHALLDYMASFPDVKFQTLGEYASGLAEKTVAQPVNVANGSLRE